MELVDFFNLSVLVGNENNFLDSGLAHLIKVLDSVAGKSRGF